MENRKGAENENKDECIRTCAQYDSCCGTYSYYSISGFSRKTLAAENNVITVEEGEKDSVTFDWDKWKVESNSNPKVAKASIHTNIIGVKSLQSKD